MLHGVGGSRHKEGWGGVFKGEGEGGGRISAALAPPSPVPPSPDVGGYCLFAQGGPPRPAASFSSEILIFEAFISLPERLKCKTALCERGGRGGGGGGWGGGLGRGGMHRPGHAHFGGHRAGRGGGAGDGGLRCVWGGPHPIRGAAPPPSPRPPFFGVTFGALGFIFLSVFRVWAESSGFSAKRGRRRGGHPPHHPFVFVGLVWFVPLSFPPSPFPTPPLQRRRPPVHLS